jgi:hypothetical protein
MPWFTWVCSFLWRLLANSVTDAWDLTYRSRDSDWTTNCYQKGRILTLFRNEGEDADWIEQEQIKVGQFKDGLDMSAIREVKFLRELKHPNVIEVSLPCSLSYSLTDDRCHPSYSMFSLTNLTSI